jgi:hypothetical protein
MGYRMEVTPRGFKLAKVAGSFLGSPPRTIAILDAVTSEAPSGTVIDGEIRLPYPYLIMFCVIWFATICTYLLPAKGAFAATLVLWGGFGSLFMLAQRADAGRSVSALINRLEADLAEPLSISDTDQGITTGPNPTGKRAPTPLFHSRLQAGIFLGGITAFWGGNLILALMHRAVAGQLAHDGQAAPAEVAIVVLIVAGGLVATSQRSLLTSMTDRRVPGFDTLLRMLLPGTLSEAARKLGLNGPLVAGVLYLILFVGVFAFFGAYLVR